MAGHSNEDVAVEVDVLIVGAGPVGMLGGILASRHGLTALVVERRDGPQTAPAAHVVNARTYEICRQAGLDMERIHAAGKSEADAGHVNFVTRLAGDLIGRLPFERQDDACLAYTPTPLRNLSQHRFEPILADELRASDGAELRYRHQWEHSEEVGDAVISDVSDLDTGETIRVRSRYAIGCDGAGSRVRKLIGIEMVGPPLLQCYLMIHFAANLRELTAERPAVLHFVLDPEAGGAFIAHDVESDWVFMHAIDPSIESVEDYSDERCREVIDNAAGTTLDAEILGKGTWWMSSQTADSMGRGRIFLAGDSAHRFPPTGGLGLNSGVQNIHGLMWRIGAIVAGRANSGLGSSMALTPGPSDGRSLAAAGSVFCGDVIWAVGRRSGLRRSIATWTIASLCGRWRGFLRTGHFGTGYWSPDQAARTAVAQSALTASRTGRAYSLYMRPPRLVRMAVSGPKQPVST